MSELEGLKELVKSQADEIEDLRDHVEDLKKELEDERDTREDLEERVDELEERVDELEEHVDDLEVRQTEQEQHSGRERANNRRRLTDLEDRLDAVEEGDRPQGSDGEDDDARPYVEPETPLEDLANLPTEATQDQRANIRRALFVARDVKQYTKKVPKGRAITWSELQTVLFAGTDASYATDVTRTMEVLSKFGKDTVRIVDRPDRPKIVCFDEEAATRLDHLCADSQSTNDVVSTARG